MYRRRYQYSLVGTFHGRRSPLMRTGLFRQVMDLKIQKEKIQAVLYGEWNPCWEGHSVSFHGFPMISGG
jgi:hypothetical protein